MSDIAAGPQQSWLAGPQQSWLHGHDPPEQRAGGPSLAWGECGHEGWPQALAGSGSRSSFLGWRSLRWGFVALSPAGCCTVRKQVHREERSVADRVR